MKFKEFIKKYYEVSHREFPISYNYEERKTLEKSFFERKRGETVSLLASERKRAIVNSYIFLLICVVLSLIFSLIDIRFLWGSIFLLPIVMLRFIYVDFSIINIFIYYLAYINFNNVFKELLKENFNQRNLINEISKKDKDIHWLNCNFRKFSLFKLKYEILMSNAYFIKMEITRNSLILKSKINKLVIKNKKLSKEELINLIREFLKEHIISPDGKQFEWKLLKTVKFKEKFEVYGCTVSLERCICENKEVGINIKNQYNTKKAVKYRFHIDNIFHFILVNKINDKEYVIFYKQEIN